MRILITDLPVTDDDKVAHDVVITTTEREYTIVTEWRGHYAALPITDDIRELPDEILNLLLCTDCDKRLIKHSAGDIRPYAYSEGC